MESGMDRDMVAIRENGRVREFCYEELLRYHGGEMPGGVALAFRMLQWIFEDILEELPERGKCTFYSGLGKNGQGIIDTVKLVTGVEENRTLFLDIEYSVDKCGPVAPGGGRYYFEFGCDERLVKLGVKNSAIPEGFLEYSARIHRKRQRREAIREEEMQHLQKLRKELSKAILSADSDDLFMCIES